jgi:hypothetical protein
MSPNDLEDIRTLSLDSSIDYSSSGQAEWDMRNNYFEVIDGKGKVYKIDNTRLARDYVFAEHQNYMDWTCGGITKGQKDKRSEATEEDMKIEEEPQKGLWGWAGRHKKGIATGFSGLMLVGIGSAIIYHEKEKIGKWVCDTLKPAYCIAPHESVTPVPVSTPSCLADQACVGDCTEYEGIKIFGSKENRDDIVKGLKELKQYNPDDFKFVKQHTKAISPQDCDGGIACAGGIGYGDGCGNVYYNPDCFSDSNKCTKIRPCDFVHEAEHLNGGGEKEAYARGAECFKEMYNKKHPNNSS